MQCEAYSVAVRFGTQLHGSTLFQRILKPVIVIIMNQTGESFVRIQVAATSIYRSDIQKLKTCISLVLALPEHIVHK